MDHFANDIFREIMNRSWTWWTFYWLMKNQNCTFKVTFSSWNTKIEIFLTSKHSLCMNVHFIFISSPLAHKSNFPPQQTPRSFSRVVFSQYTPSQIDLCSVLYNESSSCPPPIGPETPIWPPIGRWWPIVDPWTQIVVLGRCKNGVPSAK